MQIRLQASDNGNVAVLTTPTGDEVLNGKDLIVEIAADSLRRITARLPSEEFNRYLESGDYALDIDGIRAFLDEQRGN